MRAYYTIVTFYCNTQRFTHIFGHYPQNFLFDHINIYRSLSNIMSQDRLKELVASLNCDVENRRAGSTFTVLSAKPFFKSTEETLLFFIVLSTEGRLCKLTLSSKTTNKHFQAMIHLRAGLLIRLSGYHHYEERIFLGPDGSAIEEPDGEITHFQGPKQFPLHELPLAPAMTEPLRVGSIQPPKNKPVIVCSGCGDLPPPNRLKCPKCNDANLIMKVTVVVFFVDQNGFSIKALLAFDRIMDLMQISEGELIEKLAFDPEASFIQVWLESDGKNREFICLLNPMGNKLQKQSSPSNDCIRNVERIWDADQYPYKIMKRRRK